MWVSGCQRELPWHLHISWEIPGNTSWQGAFYIGNYFMFISRSMRQNRSEPRSGTACRSDSGQWRWLLTDWSVPSLVLTAQLKYTTNDGTGLTFASWQEAHVVLQVHNFSAVWFVNLHRCFLFLRANTMIKSSLTSSLRKHQFHQRPRNDMDIGWYCCLS
jgi:hypothetical protein